jgi:hypothetical protein
VPDSSAGGTNAGGFLTSDYTLLKPSTPVLGRWSVWRDQVQSIAYDTQPTPISIRNVATFVLYFFDPSRGPQ